MKRMPVQTPCIGRASPIPQTTTVSAAPSSVSGYTEIWNCVYPSPRYRGFRMLATGIESLIRLSKGFLDMMSRLSVVFSPSYFSHPPCLCPRLYYGHPHSVVITTENSLCFHLTVLAPNEGCRRALTMPTPPVESAIYPLFRRPREVRLYASGPI